MRRGLVRSFDQRMAAQRRVAGHVADLTAKLRVHDAIKAEVAAEHRVERMRRERLRQQRQSEADQGAMLDLHERQRHDANLLGEQEARLVSELQRRKSSSASSHARHRRLCEQSEELRALSGSLQAAEISKERQAQIDRNRQTRQQHVADEIALDLELDRERDRAELGERERAATRAKASAALKDDLDRQIRDRQRRRRATYEEFLQEKRQVDDVVEQVLAKEQDAEREKATKRAELRETLHEHEVNRQQVQARVAAEEAADLDRIRAWADLQEQRLGELAARKQQHQEREAAQYDRVATGMERRQKERDEMDQLLVEMFIDQADRKVEEAAAAAEERRIAQRREMVESYRLQQVAIEQKRTQQKEQEKALRATMLAKFVEDDRVEQMNAERARRVKMEHHRIVQAMVDERRALFEQERQEEVRERQRALDDEEERLQIIERERERMLVEHARRLRDYLPRGVVRTDNDRRLVFGEEGAGST